MTRRAVFLIFMPDILERIFAALLAWPAHYGTVRAVLWRCSWVADRWRCCYLQWSATVEKQPLAVEQIALGDIIGAVNRAIQRGKTPLIVDRSKDHNVRMAECLLEHACLGVGWGPAQRATGQV